MNLIAICWFPQKFLPWRLRFLPFLIDQSLQLIEHDAFKFESRYYRPVVLAGERFGGPNFFADIYIFWTSRPDGRPLVLNKSAACGGEWGLQIPHQMHQMHQCVALFLLNYQSIWGTKCTKGVLSVKQDSCLWWLVRVTDTAPNAPNAPLKTPNAPKDIYGTKGLDDVLVEMLARAREG